MEQAEFEQRNKGTEGNAAPKQEDEYTECSDEEEEESVAGAGGRWKTAGKLVATRVKLVSRLKTKALPVASARWAFILETDDGEHIGIGDGDRLVVLEGIGPPHKPWWRGYREDGPASTVGAPPGTQTQHTSLGVLHELVC